MQAGGREGARGMDGGGRAGVLCSPPGHANLSSYMHAHNTLQPHAGRAVLCAHKHTRHRGGGGGGGGSPAFYRDEEYLRPEVGDFRDLHDFLQRGCVPHPSPCLANTPSRYPAS